MNPKTYQDEAHKFAQYGDNATYPLLGLAEECGEVAGKVAKFIRKNMGFPPATATHDDYPSIMYWNEKNGEFKKNLSKELGDVCWMVAELCSVYGLDLEEVMEENIAKLQDRQNRGVIVGEGDNR